MALLDIALTRMIRRGTLAVTFASGETRTFGNAEAGWADVAIRLHDTRVANEIVRNPQLGVGEAYMDGRLTVERGDIMDFVMLVRANNPWEAKAIKRGGALRKLAKRLSRQAREFNDLASARRNVAHHYDLDDRLFDLFLDEERQYSCGYWAEGVETLHEAQIAKLAHIAAKLALQPGIRVLDIGCGWGGITLSEEQLGFAKARAAREGTADKVRFELIDYRDIKAQFDRVVSIGMFEHVGLANYPDFFRNCRGLLREDGVMLLHTVGRMGRPTAMDAFTLKHTFPGSYVPALSEIVAASEHSRLIVTDIETWRLHCARTLRAWYDRCVEARAQLESVYDARFYRMWIFYLAGAAAGFEQGGTVNYKIQYARSRNAVPITRDYMAETERRYLAGTG